LGELVHNPIVLRRLRTLGITQGDLDKPDPGGPQHVMIAAHGASDTARRAWQTAGHIVHDTTCTLVRKAHASLQRLVEHGFHPVIIGKKGHVEVNGLAGDFPGAIVVNSDADINMMPEREKFGVISQTTQVLARATRLVNSIQERFPASLVCFVDTICQPTKDRQESLFRLCAEVEVLIVVGGHNSNNTAQLALTARAMGVRAYRVEGPQDLKKEWFLGVERAGITAGTSTLTETVDAVEQRMIDWARQFQRRPLQTA
jgi:4-hydroxy-3-methylbut-2-enyl diphosphate reductase